MVSASAPSSVGFPEDRRTVQGRLQPFRASKKPQSSAHVCPRLGSGAYEPGGRELRKVFDVSQEELAKILDVKQANVSKIERREDIRLSALVTYIRVMGGDIEIIARFPNRSGGKDKAIKLKPFVEDTADAA